MMRIALSILLSLSMLAGSVGIHMMNSSCDCCGAGMVCECSSACELVSEEKTDPVMSCCSNDQEDKDQDNKTSCSSDCCITEYYKLDVPLIISFSVLKVNVSELEIPFQFTVNHISFSNLLYSGKVLRVPDKPPLITRSGLDLSCTFLC